MSTIIVMGADDAVHWITDAGQYDPVDGSLVAVRSKVYELPGGVAYAWRGAGGDWYDRIADQLQDLYGIEQIAGALAGLASKLHAAALQEPDAPAEGWDMELWVAGWHAPSKRVVAAWLSSAPMPDDPYGPEPFQLREMPVFTMAPAPAEPLVDILGCNLTEESISQLDPVVDGLALIEAQRRAPQRGGFCVAGGRAELTRIDQVGVARWTLRDWCDPLGIPIDPVARQAEKDKRFLA